MPPFAKSEMKRNQQFFLMKFSHDIWVLYHIKILCQRTVKKKKCRQFTNVCSVPSQLQLVEATAVLHYMKPTSLVRGIWMYINAKYCRSLKICDIKGAAKVYKRKYLIQYL